jgi:hypothetical protein
MSQYFNYNSSGPSRLSAPIFPDFNPRSEMAQKMFNAKMIEDDSYWSTMREVFAHDLKTLPMERFKVWASVLSIPFMTRIRCVEYTSMALKAAAEDPRFENALLEPMIGCDEQDFKEQFSVFDNFNTTGNRIAAVCHLLSCGYTPADLEKMDTIIEFGAGIGELCDVIHKLGFKGKYIIYDLPEVGAIQKWYHGQLGHKNVVHTADLEDLQIADLCIGTWSLTEMPIELRNKILSKTVGTKNWLLAYSNQIFGIDNNEWVNDTFIPIVAVDKEVQFKDIKSMPWHAGTKYLAVKERS